MIHVKFPKHKKPMIMRKVLLTLLSFSASAIVFAQTATYQYNRGSYLAASGSFAEAIPYYDEAIKLNPGMEEAWFSRGEAKYRLADYRGAIDDFSKALALNPKDRDAFFFRAACNGKLADLSSSIIDYSQAIAISPDFAQAYVNRGNAKFKLNDKEGACQDWEKAVQFGLPNESNISFCKAMMASR